MSEIKRLLIIPAYNEEKNIISVIDNIKNNSEVEIDFVIIDDNSSDATFEIARSFNIPVIHHCSNLGIGGAVQTGFKYAVKNGYDQVLQFDADGQHDPSEIVSMFTELDQGDADIIIGSRYLEKTDYHTPFFRRAGMIFFSMITSYICKQKITDTTSGFRALNRKCFSFLAREYPIDFPDAEAIIIMNFHGIRIRETSVKMNPRLSGHSSTGWWKSLYYPFKTIISIIAALLRKKVSI